MPHQTVPMNGLFDAEYFDLPSDHVGDTYRIFVGKPSASGPSTAHHTIFALDGNASFASLLGTQRMLTQGAEVPPAFVIGIGYSGATLMEAMANRSRDYAPTDPGEAEARALGASVPSGAPAFRRFIHEELKPVLADHYPLDVDDSTLQGISLGGLFGAWTLLTEPATFKRYILGSPALWWRNEEVWDWEQTYAETHDDLAATVFLSAGALEVEAHLRADAAAIAAKSPLMREHIESLMAWNDEHGWPEIAKLTPRLASRLRSRAFPGLTIRCHNMPDENHMSAPPAITSRGLRYVFGTWRP